MKEKGSWTIRYILMNVTYFAAFCTIHACAAVFLLAHGFSNTEVGVLLAIANISSAICQPVVAGMIDKPGWLSNRRFILISVLTILAGSLILMAAADKKAIVFIVYALIYMIQFAYQPVMTALCFEYQKAGCSINYGLARGLGSAGFAFTSMFVGKAVEAYGVDLLLIINIAVMVLSAVIAYTFKKPADVSSEKSVSADSDDAMQVKGTAHNNIADLRYCRNYMSVEL